jgi:hypothetical protein
MTKSHKMTFAALAAIAVVLSAPLLVLSVATPAEAKITQECRNPGGQEPQAQNCPDKHERNVNPAGKAPPGHN